MDVESDRRNRSIYVDDAGGRARMTRKQYTKQPRKKKMEEKGDDMEESHNNLGSHKHNQYIECTK